jgi:hypothetical protein
MAINALAKAGKNSEAEALKRSFLKGMAQAVGSRQGRQPAGRGRGRGGR